MPLVEPTRYRAPWPLRLSPHVETVFPTLFRRPPRVAYARERIATADGDFLDLDWSAGGDGGARGVVIVSHGMEGSSASHYVKGAVAAVREAGWNAVAWNFRGCSGEPNRQLRWYHSGFTEDLHAVVAHVLAKGPRAVALVGFSLGGNLTLKYLGERDGHDPRVRAAVTFSVPCDLAGASLRIGSPSNRLYMLSFLWSLRRKIRAKMRTHPGRIDDSGFHRIRDFKGFDDRYTAPLNGFRDAEDYWARAASLPFLGRIRVPTLLVQARNDPFLSASCHPVDEARKNPALFLEAPDHGGHVGFTRFAPDGRYWSELRIVEFLDAVVEGGEERARRR